MEYVKQRDLVLDESTDIWKPLGIKICTDPENRGGGEFLVRCPSDVKQHLDSVSQWGLKELWVGAGVRGHNRWRHSVGVLHVALYWLKHLKDVNKWKQIYPVDLEFLVAEAAVLHDYGHLPFAHLIGEVLERLRWIPRTMRHIGIEGLVLQRGFRNLHNGFWGEVATILKSEEDQARELVEALILGDFGIPWIQAIINSPIDADKIDYIIRDSHFLEMAKYPFTSRIGFPKAWLDEFISQQYVSPAGLLCLEGRSAVCAVDLLLERIHLYERFYLSPRIRAVERMAAEIIKRFAILSIRYPMKFGDTVTHNLSRENNLDDSKEISEEKLNFIVPLLIKIHQKYGQTDKYEMGMLEKIKEDIKSIGKHLSSKYISMVDSCYKSLNEIYEKCKEYQKQEEKHPPVELDRLIYDKIIVREPITFRREHYEKALEVANELQLVYQEEVLIDIVRMPRVLSAPRKWRFSRLFEEKYEMDYSILVPDGPVSTWGPKSVPRVPFTDESVQQLEKPIGRILVISPRSDIDRVKLEYIWDRVRARLIDNGVELLPPGGVR